MPAELLSVLAKLLSVLAELSSVVAEVSGRLAEASRVAAEVSGVVAEVVGGNVSERDVATVPSQVLAAASQVLLGPAHLTTPFEKVSPACADLPKSCPGKAASAAILSICGTYADPRRSKVIRHRNGLRVKPE